MSEVLHLLEAKQHVACCSDVVWQRLWEAYHCSLTIECEPKPVLEERCGAYTEEAEEDVGDESKTVVGTGSHCGLVGLRS